MTNTPPILPPEVVRIVASYMDPDVVLALSMTNRFCAGLFEGIYYNNWEVDCCSKAQEATIRESNEIYTTNMDWFFRALKSGFAPAYAKKVHFAFCTHKKPVHRANSCSKRSLQSNWPLRQTREFLELLYASEIVVVIINDPHQRGCMCNEPFLRALLRHSCRVLPNAVVKLRVDNREAPGLDSGSFYFTIRDSSTPQATVADNLQRALRQIRSSSMNYDLWDGHEHYIIFPARQIVGIYPNVTELSFSHGDDYDPMSLEWNFVRPEEYLTAFPQCERITCRWEKFGHNQCLETTFCFDNVPAHGRKCTRILVHNVLCFWLLEQRCQMGQLKHVKVLEFHQFARPDSSEMPYTPSTMNVLLEGLLLSLPKLERMILKFGAGMIMADTNYPGTLSKGFCEHCELAVNILEFDIGSLPREGRLSTGEYLLAVIGLVRTVWQDKSTGEATPTEFTPTPKAHVIRALSIAKPAPYVIHRLELEAHK